VKNRMIMNSNFRVETCVFRKAEWLHHMLLLWAGALPCHCVILTVCTGACRSTINIAFWTPIPQISVCRQMKPEATHLNLCHSWKTSAKHLRYRIHCVVTLLWVILKLACISWALWHCWLGDRKGVLLIKNPAPSIFRGSSAFSSPVGDLA